MKQRIRGLCAGVTLVLSGCAIQPAPPAGAWATSLPRLEAVDHWSLSGKIGIVQPGRADSAMISSWEQLGARYRIRLSSSVLGLGQVDIEGTPDFLVLRESGEPDRVTDDPEALIRAETGWDLPLGQLRYWVLGLSAPGSRANTEFGPDGYPRQIRQSGWTITPSDYQSAGNDPGLVTPRRLTLERDTIRIKLVVRDWQAIATTP